MPGKGPDEALGSWYQALYSTYLSYALPKWLHLRCVDLVRLEARGTRVLQTLVFGRYTRQASTSQITETCCAQLLSRFWVLLYSFQSSYKLFSGLCSVYIAIGFIKSFSYKCIMHLTIPIPLSPFSPSVSFIVPVFLLLACHIYVHLHTCDVYM